MKLTVKQARLLAGYTQKQIAELLGVHMLTYWKWEKNPGKMSISTAKKFSEIVGRKFDEIIFDEEMEKGR